MSLAAALGGWVLFGGPVGLLVAGVAGAFSWRVLSKVEPPALVRRRRELERDLPIAVHLFGSALAVGSSTTRALADVAEALPGSVADEFSLLRRRLELGADPASVWRSVEGPLQPLGRTMARAQESGSLVVAAVERLGAELSAAVAVRRAARVRTVEVRAAMPLGVCFLPAFVVLGVIPMVVGIFSSLSLFD